MANEYPARKKHAILCEKITTETDPEIIKKLCIEDIALLPAFRIETKKFGDDLARYDMEFDRKLGLKVQPIEYYKQKNSVAYAIPRFFSFKTLCILYEKEGRIDDAIRICKAAIDEGFGDDRTKGGMQGRLDRLIKKANKVK